MKLLQLEAKRLCSRIYEIPRAFTQCGSNLAVFRMGVLQLKKEYHISHTPQLGHVVVFPEDLEEEENVLLLGVVD